MLSCLKNMANRSKQHVIQSVTKKVYSNYTSKPEEEKRPSKTVLANTSAIYDSVRMQSEY